MNTLLESNLNNRLGYKKDAVKFKDDDYETPREILQDLIPYLGHHRTIYDPFYCDGYVKQEWTELGYFCINEKKDAFNPKERLTDNFDIIITNPPFSCKEKVLKLCLSYKKPFMILFPIDCLGSAWIRKYFDTLQFLIPKKRYNFYKKGQEKKSSCWFDTMWVCYDINLPHKVVKL